MKERDTLKGREVRGDTGPQCETSTQGGQPIPNSEREGKGGTGEGPAELSQSANGNEIESLSDFHTLTMARICLEQGHIEEANFIFERLIQKAQNDAARIMELNEIIGKALLAHTVSSTKMNGESAVLPHSYGRNFLASIPLRPTRVAWVWETTEEGKRSAAALLGETGSLVLRVIRVSVHKIRHKRSEMTLPVSGDAGECVIEIPPEDAFLVGALGLVAWGTFAPIVHSEPLRVQAPGKPPPGDAGEEILQTPRALGEDVHLTILEVDPARGSDDIDLPSPRKVRT